MRNLIVSAAVLAASMAFSNSAMAIDWSLGAGAAVAPDYEGSDDYTAIPLWNVKASDLYHPATYVQIKGPKLNSNFLPHDNWRLGLSGQYIFERDDVDNDQVDDLGSTDDGLLLGIRAGYEFGAGGGMMGLFVDGRYDVQDDIGGLLTLRGEYTRPLGSNFVLNAGIDSTYASEDYMEEYFGVDAGGAAASGLNTYDPDASFKDISFDAALSWQLTNRWSFTALGRYSRLIGDADDDSPVVDVGSENQFVAGLMVGFKF